MKYDNYKIIKKVSYYNIFLKKIVIFNISRINIIFKEKGGKGNYKYIKRN